MLNSLSRRSERAWSDGTGRALRQLREHHRFMKGLFAWVGFPSKAVLYDRAPRAAGQTKWSYWRCPMGVCS